MFNILDSTQRIHSHHLIEASAGTGKTFTIENLVVRLLIESNDNDEWISLDKILVVTFTRVATRDLRNRIRSTLNTIKTIITKYIHQNEVSQNCPDYLLKSLQKNPESLTILFKKIEQALSIFDQAYIDTIHGFCAKMLSQYALECGETLSTSDPNDSLQYRNTLLKAIGEFIRTELSIKNYSNAQLKILLKKFCGDSKRLQNKLLSVIEKGIEIRIPEGLDESFSTFSMAMLRLKTSHNLTSAKILEDFIALAPLYTKILTKDKRIKSDILNSITNFAALFDKTQWTLDDFDLLITDGLLFVDLFAEENRAKRGAASMPSVHYPQLKELLAEELYPVVSQARDPRIIFARVAQECQRYTQQILKDTDVFTHQDLLVRMKTAINNPSFAHRIRSFFSAVIVDEFQDTDPTQWEIFSSLFLQSSPPWNGHLYLVGDPKQSIYSFRQADIYTYLTAANELTNGNIVTLDTNFRSHKLLIDGLNTLFNSMRLPFPLPKNAEGLPYKNVLAGKHLSLPFTDGKPCLEFWLAHGDSPEGVDEITGAPSGDNTEEKCDYEASYLIPSLIEELISLEAQGISNSRCAVLVRDHFQADLVEKMLGTAGISVRKQRGVYLGKTEAIRQLRDILKGIYNYKNRSDLIQALTTRLIGWKHEELAALDGGENLDKITSLCSGLQDTLIDQGFAPFYRDFMASIWKTDGATVLNKLLQQKGASSFYRDWQDLADLISTRQQQHNLTYEGLIDYIDRLQESLDYDEEQLKGYLDADDEGVMLMTTHVSKGLEFDVVFAIGLSKRHKGVEELIPVPCLNTATGKTSHCLVPVTDEENEEHVLYQKELDAEKLRQLYVALTRAKYRVYVPIAFGSESTGKKKVRSSPIDLMLDCLCNGCDNKEAAFCQFVDSHSDLMGYQWIDNAHTEAFHEKENEHELVPPPIITIEHSSCIIQSFTSLTRQIHNFEEPTDEQDSIGMAPNDFNNEEKNPHTLPAGNHTGILLHTIFEEINFDDVAKSNNHYDIIPLISPYVLETPFESWKNVIAEIVFNTLKTPLESPNGSFCLANINPNACYKEAPFMYSCGKESFDTGISTYEGYIKGVIDLFFEHEGYYYLLDWKSNWLGPSSDDYTPEKIQKAFKENAYNIQAAIYIEALKKYLSIVDPRPFDEIFGGVFYLFVRKSNSLQLFQPLNP